MSNVYSWRKDPFSYKKMVKLRDQDHQFIESFRDFWNSIGEKIIHEEYGIVRVEKNGDIVLKDIDYFLKRIREYQDISFPASTKRDRNKKKTNFFDDLDDLLDLDDDYDDED